MSIPDAAARLKLDPRRLRGMVWRGVLGDLKAPIGSLETDEIYVHEVKRLARVATDSNEVHS